MVYHLDMALRFDITKLDDPRRDHNGYLIADAHATRSGVFVYHHPDGSMTRELRHPDDVFRPDSISSLKNRPITDNHPIEGKVDSKNTKRLAIGMAIDDPKREDIYLDTKIQITDEDVIKKVLADENPLRELSCGYEAEVVKEDGNYQGEEYDHRQTNIKYNHIALVNHGRAGPQVRLQLDSVDGAEDEALVKAGKTSQTNKRNESKPRGDSDMIKIKRDAVKIRAFNMDAFEVQIEDNVESGEKAVELVIDRLDGAIAHIKTLEGELDHKQGRIDALGDQGKVSLSKLNNLVKERTDAINAAHYLGLTDYMDMETDAVKKAVVCKAYPQVKIDDLTSDHIEGRYDTIIEGIKTENNNLKSMQELKGPAGKGSRFPVKSDEGDPRSRFLDSTKDMYMSKEQRELNA